MSGSVRTHLMLLLVLDCLTCSTEQIQEERPLVALLHPHYFLGDVLRGGAHSAHRQEDVLLQEVPGKDLLVEHRVTDQCAAVYWDS